MKRALISDIHSNLEALTAVLADIREQGIGEVFCLGDIIGYGPNPRECLDIVRERCTWALMGNHDFACLYEPTSRTLLSSDHLLADISSNPVVEAPPPGQAERLRSLVLYKESLRRVAALDVELALPSHGPAIDDVPGLVGRRLAMHERRQARVLDALRNGAHTTWDVAYALFPDRSPLDTFLAVSEVIGHLDLLEIEGQIGAQLSDGITVWKPTR